MRLIEANERVIYQLYPKSFKDSNGDGIGDLGGIIEKLDYLKGLGVNTIWLNPIYVSPQVDNGYDVSDLYAIDPSFGTLEQFDELINKAHAKGIEVILDLVLNHTSDKHPWFQSAISDINSPYRDYYIWRQGKKDGKEPNNWASFFGGSVWQKDPLIENNYYFHLFDKAMPDLNWQEPKVRQEMINVAKFWIDHGVDGFRLDAFIHLAKADLVQDMLTDSNKPVLAEMFYANLPQVKTYLTEFISQLKAIKPGLFILGEAASADVDLAVTYTTPKETSCDTVVTFRYFYEDDSRIDHALPTNGQPKKLDLMALKQNMLEWQKRLENVSTQTLYWSNHDMPRILDRFDPKTDKLACAKMLATLMYLQRGSVCLYYGEELGMQAKTLEDISDFEDQQMVEFAKQATKKGWSNEKILDSVSRSHKMAARLPLRFDDSKYGGFSDVRPWKWTTKGKDVSSIKEQLADKTSILNFYRQILRLKQEQVFSHGIYRLENTDQRLYVYRRLLDDKEALVICNLSEEQVTYPYETDKKIILKQNVTLDQAKETLVLAAYGSVVLVK